MMSRGELFSKWRHDVASYQTNEYNRTLLAEMNFTAVVGPAGIGKSTVMNHAVELDERFKRVTGFITRPHRENDEEGMYDYYLTDDDLVRLDEQIERRDAIQYAPDPTKDVLYGTMMKDYQGSYNLKDVWESAIPGFQKLGFKTLTIVGLVAEPADWEQWFRQRFEPGDDTARKRIKEAQMALPSLIESPLEIKWLVNHNGDLDTTARGLIDLSLGEPSTIDGSKLAKGMLDTAKRLEEIYGRA